MAAGAAGSGGGKARAEGELEPAMISVDELEPVFLERAGAIFDELDTDKSGSVSVEEAAVFFGLLTRRDGRMPKQRQALKTTRRSVKLADVDGDESLGKEEFVTAFWAKTKPVLGEHLSARDAQQRLLMLDGLSHAVAAVLEITGLRRFPSEEDVVHALEIEYERLFSVVDTDGNGELERAEIRSLLTLGVIPVLQSTLEDEDVASFSADRWAAIDMNGDGTCDSYEWRQGIEALRQDLGVPVVTMLGLSRGVIRPILQEQVHRFRRMYEAETGGELPDRPPRAESADSGDDDGDGDVAWT